MSVKVAAICRPVRSITMCPEYRSDAASISSNSYLLRATTSIITITYTSSSHPLKGESTSYLLLEPSFLSLDSTFLPLRLCFLSL